MKDYPLLKLLSIDSDERQDSLVIETATEKRKIGLDEHTEIKRIGSDGLDYTLSLDEFPEIKEWYPNSKNEWLNPNSLRDGCHQHKPVGRFVFAWNAQKLRETLYDILGSTITVGETRANGIGDQELRPFTNVFICGSVCGGTGAGLFLDIANLVRFVAKQAGRQVFNYGLMALASVFDNMPSIEYCRANTYASLIELDHFQNPLNYSSERRRFYPAYRNIGLKQWNYRDSSNNRSFDYPYLFDRTNENGISFSSPSEFAGMAARFIYLLTGSDVAAEWQSVSNNMWTQLGTDRELEKPIRYASSGNTSIVYPRRKIIQLCSFKLVCHYFDIILDDSYGTVEVGKLVERFLKDSRTCSSGDEESLLANSFSLFKDPNSDQNQNIIFHEYIRRESEQKLRTLVAEIKENKKSILDSVKKWVENQDKVFASFKTQTSLYPRNLKESFVSDLRSRMSLLLNLKLLEDTANPLQDGKRYVRGSIVRTRNFLKKLREEYLSANEKFRMIEEKSREQQEEAETKYEGKLKALKDMLNSKIPLTKNIQKSLEDVFSAYQNFACEKANEYIAKLIRQYFIEIKENGTRISDGIIKELDNRILTMDNAITNFKSCKKSAEKYLDGNRAENNGGFTVEIFNPKKDIDGIYEKQLSDLNHGEEQIFETLTNYLQSKDCFDEDYSAAGTLSTNLIMEHLLSQTEKNFQKIVEDVNISERLFDDEKKLTALKAGSYLNTAGVYMSLDGIVMTGSARLDSENGKIYYVISIPRESEYEKYCSNKTRAEPGKPFVCPFEIGGEKENDRDYDCCPLYKSGKCLKNLILKSSTADLQIILSEDNGEINIFKVKAGFPLRAITSVSGPYREEYRRKIDEQESENNNKGVKDEYVHMFGNVKFADLDEKEEKLSDLKETFRRDLLITLIGTALQIDNFGVACLTADDKNSGNEPSLKLGRDFAEAVSMAESLRIDDIETVAQVKMLAKDFCDNYFASEEYRNEYIEIIRSKYEDIKHKRFGFTSIDENMFTDISKEYFEFDCKPPKNAKPFAPKLS